VQGPGERQQKKKSRKFGEWGNGLLHTEFTCLFLYLFSSLRVQGIWIWFIGARIGGAGRGYSWAHIIPLGKGNNGEAHIVKELLLF